MKTTLLSALVFSLALAGCDKAEKGAASGDNKEPAAGKTQPADDGKKAAEATTDTPGAPAEPPAVAGDGVQVSLVKPGDEPRKPLRLDIKEGSSFKAEMRMHMDMSISAAGAAQPKVKLPEMVAIMEIKTTKTSADAFEFDWKISDYDAEDSPGVMPQVLTALKTQLKTLVGTQGTGKVDSRGRNLGSTFELPPGVPTQTAQLMEGMRDAISTMSAPVPEEPIGVGGAWKVSQKMVQNGMTSNVDYIYTIKKIEGAKVTLAVDVKTNGVPGPVRNPMLPPGADATLDSMTGSGGGEVVLSMDSVVPVKSNISTKNSSKMTIKAMGQTQKMQTDVDLKIQMKAL